MRETGHCNPIDEVSPRGFPSLPCERPRVHFALVLSERRS